MVLGDPVSGKEFFDRDNEKALLFSSLEDFKKGNKKNIAIIGIRKIGKTSLFKEFIRILNERKKENINCLDIYLPEKNIYNFFRRSIAAILIECFRIMDFKSIDPLTIEKAIEIIEPKFPNTKKSLLNLQDYIEKNKLEEAFDYLFNVFEIFNNEIKDENKLIVFLDEFQRLREYERFLSSPIDNFRERIMNQKKIMYVISGSAVGMLNKLIASSNSPLYGHFKKLNLRGFSYKDAHAFIVKRKPNTISLSITLIAFLYEITNGNPFYLDILVNDFKEICRKNKHKDISPRLVQEVLERQIFSADGDLYTYFNDLVDKSLKKSGSQYFVDIIKAIAFGSRRPSQISKKTEIPLTTLPSYLKKLQDLEIITKSNLNKKNSRVAEYEFIDILFEVWIRQVYSLREDPFTKGIDLKMQIFKKNMSKIIADYSAEIGRGNEARIRELFTSFNDLNVDGLIIPKFNSVKRENILGEEIDVFCRYSKEVWIAEITKSNIKRTEIQNIKKKIIKISKKEKVKKVIIISTKEITEGALQLCKDYGFIVWDLEMVNKLLRRASMFKILI